MNWIINVLIFMMGASLASFFNLFIERRERGEDWIISRSRCDACGVEIRGLYLIPVFGYMLSKGSCRCGATISRNHPLTECFGGLVCLLHIRMMVERGVFSYLYMAWVIFLLFLALEDILFRAIYTKELVAAFVLCLIVAMIYGEFYILSGLFMSTLLVSIHLFFRQGFGEGDIYYGSLIAFSISGIWKTYLYFTMSFCLAAVIGILFHLTHRLNDGKIPMYPFFLLGWTIIQYFF